MQLKDFKDKQLYKFIGTSPLMTPQGVVTNKAEYIFTGSMWKRILVYDFSDNTAPINKLFKKVKAKKKIAKKKSKKKK